MLYIAWYSICEYYTLLYNTRITQALSYVIRSIYSCHEYSRGLSRKNRSWLTGITASPLARRASRARAARRLQTMIRWVEGAVAESALPGAAWNLVEVEFLEKLAVKLADDHPTLCAPPEGQKAAHELFSEVHVCAPARP